MQLNVGSEGSIGCNISLHKKIISTTSVSAFCDDEVHFAVLMFLKCRRSNKNISYEVGVCCDIVKHRYQGAPQNNVLRWFCSGGHIETKTSMSTNIDV
jgi:hypothetical protein